VFDAGEAGGLAQGGGGVTMRFETPTSFLCRDEFNQVVSGGSDPLTGLTAPVGGVWIGAGDTDDFVVEDTGHTAQRTAVSDTDYRFAISGVAGFTSQAVQVDFMTSTRLNLNPEMGVIARWTDINNFFGARVRGDGTINFPLQLVVTTVVAGVASALAPALTIQGTSNNWYTLRALVDAAGRWRVWYGPRDAIGSPIAQGMDSALATGGALASGKPGFRDANFGSGAMTRNFDNFFAFAHTPDAACFAGQSLEIRHDRAERENPAGTAWNRVTVPRGRYLRFAPGGQEGRSNRFFLKGVRGPEVQPGVWIDPSIDDIAVDLFATPLGVAVPEP
jgi:hypothetical protein